MFHVETFWNKLQHFGRSRRKVGTVEGFQILVSQGSVSESFWGFGIIQDSIQL